MFNEHLWVYKLFVIPATPSNNHEVICIQQLLVALLLYHSRPPLSRERFVGLRWQLLLYLSLFLNLKSHVRSHVMDLQQQGLCSSHRLHKTSIFGNVCPVLIRLSLVTSHQVYFKVLVYAMACTLNQQYQVWSRPFVRHVMLRCKPSSLTYAGVSLLRPLAW